MTAVTVSDIVNDVITELSMVGGYATQIYASARIQQHVQDATILMMEAAWWPHLTKYFQATLDGATGKITSDLTFAGYANHSIQRYQDIQFVMIAGTEQRLLRLPTNINPYNLSSGGGGTDQAQFIEPDASTPARPFTVWPMTAGDDLVIRARLYPNLPITSSDTVYLDRLMLTYLASFMYSQDDGTNQGAISKFEKLFEQRIMQVKASFEHQPIPLSGPAFAGTNQWQEAPW